VQNDSNVKRRAFPDDLREELKTRLAGDFRNGNWCDSPWFLERENDWFSEAGFPLETRRRLVAPLSKLYPPDVCRRLLLHPFEAGLVFGFFHAWPPLLIPALDVAEDLEIVPSALKSPLLRKLRRTDEFSSAAAELRVWSSLRRSGFAVDYEPKVLVDGAVRQPDLGVSVGSDYFLVEVSQLQTSAWEKAGKLLEEVLLFGSDAFFEDRLVRVLPSPTFLATTAREIAALLEVDDRDTRDKVASFVRDRLLPSFREALEEVRTRSAAPGIYSVNGIGTVELTVKAGKEAVSELMPRLPPEEVALRVLRKALEEARQLQPGRRRIRRGVVVIEMGRAASLVPVARALARIVARGKISNLERLDNVDALLLRGMWQTPGGEHAAAAHLIVNNRVFDTKASRATMDLFYALGGGHIVVPHGSAFRIKSRSGDLFEQKVSAPESNARTR
jgi:hypothetical protein